MAIVDHFYRNGYEQEFELELKDKDGNPSGLKVWVRDLECDAAIAVENEYAAKTTDLNLRYVRIDGDDVVSDIPEGERGELFQSRARDKYIACISRWDFNGEGLFSDDEPDPECSYENKLKFMGIPGINNQVIAKIDEISGFTLPLKKG